MKNILSLSDEDVRKVSTFVSNNDCKHANYEMLETVFSLREISAVPTTLKGHYSVAVFYCRDCGFVKLHDLGKLKQILSLRLSFS